MSESVFPKISVVTVSYNAVTTIEETILSVVNQTYKNIEYIIIDGGSTDGTVDIIKKYADRIDYWVSEPDKGIYDAMNKGFFYSNGDWVNFMNSDDRFFNNSVIDNLCEYIIFNNNTQSLYYGGVLFCSKSKSIVYTGKFSKYSLVRKNICHQAIFYPRNIYKNYQYNSKYPLYADWEFNIRAYKNVKFTYVGTIIACYSLSGRSFNVKDEFFLQDLPSLIRTNLGISAYFFYIIIALLKRISFLRIFRKEKVL